MFDIKTKTDTKNQSQQEQEPNEALVTGMNRELSSSDALTERLCDGAVDPIPGVKEFLSPSDILFTDFTGSFSLWASATDIGLFPDDELDALDTPVPEPSSSIPLIVMVMLGIGSALRGKLKQE